MESIEGPTRSLSKARSRCGKRSFSAFWSSSTSHLDENLKTSFQKETSVQKRIQTKKTRDGWMLLVQLLFSPMFKSLFVCHEKDGFRFWTLHLAHGFLLGMQAIARQGRATSGQMILNGQCFGRSSTFGLVSWEGRNDRKPLKPLKIHKIWHDFWQNKNNVAFPVGCRACSCLMPVWKKQKLIVSNSHSMWFYCKCLRVSFSQKCWSDVQPREPESLGCP